MQSHPGKELKEHLSNVKELGLNIFDSKNTKWKNDEKIRKVLEIILLTHDYGKGTEYFQEYIGDTENKKYQMTPYNELKRHGELGALWCYYLIMKETDDLKLAFMGYMIVRKHHGNIVDFEKEIFLTDNQENLVKIIDSFDYEYFEMVDEKENFMKETEILVKGNYKLSREFRKIVDNIFTIEDYIFCNFIFSILISADKGEAIFYSAGKEFDKLLNLKNKRHKLERAAVDLYKERKFGKSKNGVDEKREEIYREVEKNILMHDLEKNRIFSINVPTGTGKTLTSMNGALKLREKLGGKHRIIYTLPFTSVIDQNFKVFADVIGEKSNDSSVLLKHHYLADKEYKISEDELDYSISEYMIENWDSEIIVTTFVQLLNSLLTNKNRSLKKFHNIAESIIILDEVQSIPYKYWKLINNVLKKLSENLDCYIILVTATMPLIFSEEKEEIIELAMKKEEYFNYFDRITLDISKLDKAMDIEGFTEFTVKEIDENRDDSFLFVLNTVKTSLKTYEKIKHNYPEKDVIYLSTNIIPQERLKRIDKIKKNRGVIVIATQLVEAGVDIDIDRVYRDFGPLDSINQVCGRCNRNGIKDKKGIVKLVKIKDSNNKDKLFSSYVYKSQLLDKATENSFKNMGEIIQEKAFFKLAKNYFSNIESGKSDDQSTTLLNYIEKLQYEKAFEYSDENKDSRFELISQNFKTVDLFIEIDEKASVLWGKYREIYSEKTNRYEAKEIFSKIKSEFLSYVISVPEKFYRNGKEGFNRIDRESLKMYYDLDTGFKREEKQDDYFF